MITKTRSGKQSKEFEALLNLRAFLALRVQNLEDALDAAKAQHAALDIIFGKKKRKTPNRRAR